MRTHRIRLRPDAVLRAFEAVHKEKAAPAYPAELLDREKESRTQDVAGRQQWIEAQLLAQLAPDQATRDALARARAQAVQNALLADGQIAPERVFITADRSAITTEVGAIRMEMKLE